MADVVQRAGRQASSRLQCNAVGGDGHRSSDQCIEEEHAAGSGYAVFPKRRFYKNDVFLRVFFGARRVFSS